MRSLINVKLLVHKIVCSIPKNGLIWLIYDSCAMYIVHIWCNSITLNWTLMIHPFSIVSLWVINRLATIIFRYINQFWNYKSVKLKPDSAELARRRQFTTTYMQRVANHGTRRPHLKKQRDSAASEAGLHRCRGCMLFRGCPPLAVRRAYYAYRHACRAPCQPRTVPAAWSAACTACMAAAAVRPKTRSFLRQCSWL